MTTTSTPPRPQPQPPRAAPLERRPSLLRAEIRRLCSRRFIQVLVALAVIGYLVIVAVMAFRIFGSPTEQDLATAKARQEQAISEQNQFREECLQGAGDIPPGTSPDEVCGEEATPEMLPVETFVDRQPFVLASYLPGGSVAVASFAAALAFIIGATYVGAEWSTRSMVALLFWEPRRLKVVGVKLLVVAGMAAVLAVVSQAVWTATAHVLARTRGTTGRIRDDFWSDLLAQQGRGVLLVMLMALLGFGLANLIRNTGAALGIGFVYFAIIENVVPAFRPALQEWLIVPNIAALLSNGGHRIFVGPSAWEADAEVREVTLSNLHGGLVIAGIVSVIIAVGVILFQRRDLH